MATKPDFFPLVLRTEMARIDDTRMRIVREVGSPAYAELGGQRTFSEYDERVDYLPAGRDYLASLVHGPEKTDIRRGLEGLGLMALTSSDLDTNLSRPDSVVYAAALSRYLVRLQSRKNLLLQPASAANNDVVSLYPGATDEWLQRYARELKDLSTLVSDSEVMYRVKSIAAHYDKAFRNELKRQGTVPSRLSVELHRSNNGRYRAARVSVVRSKRPAAGTVAV